MNKKLSISLVASFIIATNLSSSTQLEQITITSATKSEQSIKDVTSNVEVITKEEIEERHFTSVNEALNTLAGVSFSSNGGLGSNSNIYLRGMGNVRTLVLIDGVRFQDPSNTNGANLSHLMINDIEKIEVIKGAQSGIWGAEAAAGVINIITKKAKKGTHISGNIEAGSFNTKKYGVSLSHTLENFDIKLNANKIDTDGFSNATPYGKNPKDYEKDGYENTILALDTNIYFNQDSKLNLNIKDINAVVEYDAGFPTNPNDDTMKSDVDTTIYSTTFNQKISNHNLKLNYQLSKFKRDEKGTTWGVKNFNGETQNIELSDEIKYIKDGFLILGVGTTKDEVNYIKTDKTTNKKDSESKYIYLTNSNKFDKLVLTQSLRYDKYENFDNQLTGKFGAKYSINNNLSFSSNIGTAYNVPSIIKQLNPWGAANLNLQPEKTKSFDIGFEYKNFTTTYFKSKVDDLIDWSGTGYKNVKGKTKFEGVELSYKKDLTSDLFLTTNYTYLSARDSNNNVLARRPKSKLGASLDYYGIKDFHFNVNSSYIGTRYDRNDKQGANTGNYTLWNCVVNYDINKNFKAYLKVDNIFNKYYQNIDGYGTPSRSGYVGLKAIF